MAQYIDKSAVVAEIVRRRKEIPKNETDKALRAVYGNEAFVLTELLSFLDTLEVKESDETAEAFARIIRANLTGIDKDVQYKFKQLYKEITGEKMYQGYKD